MEAAEEPLGRRSRVLGAMAYGLGPLSGLAVLLYAREDRFARFHALQSIFGGSLLGIAGGVLRALAALPVLGFLYDYLLRIFLLFVFALWAWVLLRALRGSRAQLPWMGEIIARYLY